MLSIERRPGESLFLGDDIQVQVLAIGHTFVSLAIRAPRQVTILRSEVDDRGLQAGPGSRGGGPAPMLIVRRRVGESLRIGSGVELAVVRLRAARVCLAVSADPGIRIHRGGRRAEENAESSSRAVSVSR